MKFYAVSGILLILFSLQASAQAVLKDSDHFHFSVREIVNRSSFARSFSYQLNLCAAIPGNDTISPNCKTILKSETYVVASRPFDANFASLLLPEKPGTVANGIGPQPQANSAAVTGVDVKNSALSLARGLDFAPQALRYYFIIEMYEELPNERRPVDRKFGTFPPLTMAADQNTKTLTDKFNLTTPANDISSRVLSVITRHNELN